MKNIFFALMMLFVIVFASCNEGKDNDKVVNEIEVIDDIEEVAVELEIEGGITPVFSSKWKELDYDKCIAYFCEVFYRERSIAKIGNESINPKISVLKSIEIAKKDADELKEMFSSSLHGAIVDCVFMPRHAFVFYKNNKIVAQSSICFSCSQVESVPFSGINFDIASKVFKEYEIPSNNNEIKEYHQKYKVIEDL